ncbi:thioesterase II family protein [Kutzneria sp. 744]|uniref:thioesterase II family protein n=1 Tax=Kutzneria sp. (strain 744) TaxID=345341 RepID=UPI0003EED64D|nr:alpha/beta fold hydrolase [Kutzneria sp. 744]EWM18589.1 thioesterase [Kutzneria sp. 744]
MTRRGARVVACIPPSCCGAGYFRRLRRKLSDRVEVRAVELPGHGRRYGERAVTRAELAVRDVIEQLGGPVDVLYGESLGAYLGLAVAAAVERPPFPLLVAASNPPPSVREDIRIEGVRSIETAVAALAATGGRIPAEVVADPELAAGAYPLIRDDLRLAKSLVDATRATTVAGDILVVGGENDIRPTSWAAHTTGRCEVRRLPGEHLLAAANPEGVADLILGALAQR